MCRRNSVQWYIESADGLRVLVESETVGLYFEPKVFVPDPKLYKKVKTARIVAHANDGVVKHFDRPRYDILRELPF